MRVVGYAQSQSHQRQTTVLTVYHSTTSIAEKIEIDHLASE
jgi:hypothetical protein